MTPSRSEDLKIELFDSPAGAQVLKLSGPLTLRTLFEFQDVARRDAVKPVIIDLTAVPYMDSAGLGAVISVFASCQRTHRGFGIVGVSERIKTLLEVTHCDGLLPCYTSTESAESAIFKA